MAYTNLQNNNVYIILPYLDSSFAFYTFKKLNDMTRYDFFRAAKNWESSLRCNRQIHGSTGKRTKYIYVK